MKANIDIEALLIWAYREELPREPAPISSLALALTPGWNAIERFGELNTLIDGGDARNRWGVTPDRAAQRGPHPDAIRVAEAVGALAGFVVETPDDWWPFGDMAPPDGWGDAGRRVIADALDRLCAPAQDGGRRFKSSPAWIVRKHAMMGTVPDWEAEVPEYRMVVSANGKPKWFAMRSVPQVVNGEVVTYVDCEQDGYSPSRKRPVRGAYNKWELVPSPFYAACDRAEYEIWHSGLCLLAESLRDDLERWTVTGPRRRQRPWDPQNGVPARVLPALGHDAKKGA